MTRPAAATARPARAMPSTAVIALTTRKMPAKARTSGSWSGPSWPGTAAARTATGRGRPPAAAAGARTGRPAWPPRSALLGAATSQRRSRISPASTSPSASTPATSQGSAASSPRPSGPSTIAPMSSGMASPARLAASASPALPSSASAMRDEVGQQDAQRAEGRPARRRCKGVHSCHHGRKFGPVRALEFPARPVTMRRMTAPAGPHHVPLFFVRQRITLMVNRYEIHAATPDGQRGPAAGLRRSRSG